MAHKTKVGGTAYDISGGKTLVGGTGYDISKGRTLVGGTGYDINFVKGVPLGSIPEGTIIYLNENGAPVPFYVAKHNYEKNYNRNRTLLVRKDCYGKRVYERTGDSNGFNGSDVDTWLNGTYKRMLANIVKSALGSTIFKYTPGYPSGDTEVTTLKRSVFLLSLYELGRTAISANSEGSQLPIYSTLQKAYLNGSACKQWTRTPDRSANNIVHCLSTSGYATTSSNTDSEGVRPCFTLPASIEVNPSDYTIIG